MNRDTSYARQLRAIYDDWERRVRVQAEAEGDARGRAQGELQGLRESLVACYRARFGSFPAEFRAVVEATTDAATLRRWVALCAAATADDITAAFSAASRA